MGSLNFLNTPEWKRRQSKFPGYERIMEIEEDYWWIDENEPQKECDNLEYFYNQCLRIFEKIVLDSNIPYESITPCDALLPVGEKVVYEYLYDRYLAQRHETDPDIFYSYVVQLSFEAGITIARKWQTNSAELGKYIDKIIRETSFDDIGGIYQQYLNVDSEQVWLGFMSKLSNPVYDLLKWYHKQENFEEYKLRLLLAAFQTGAAVSVSNCK